MDSIRRIIYTVREEADIDTVFAAVCQEYPRHEAFDVQLERRYLDSFDWRLYRNNLVCGLDRRDRFGHSSRKAAKDHGGLFFVADKATGADICEFPVAQTPRFSKDIEHHACRKLLSSHLGIRALMTVASIAVKRRQLNILNQDNKTVAMLSVESYALKGDADKTIFPSRVIVSPVKGYRKTFRQVIQMINDQLRLPSVETTLLDEMLAAEKEGKVEIKIPAPGELTLSQPLKDTHTTGEAVRLLLRHFLHVMQANEPGLRDAIDTEFLHDYRVAVRRTRTLLSQIKQIFPAKPLDYFRHELFWLGQITGPTRDLDIYLLNFDGYRQELPKVMQKHLTPFHEFLERHWKSEHARLCRKLDSKRYQRLIKVWRDTLEEKNINPLHQTRQKKTAEQETVNVTLPARQVAGKSIWKLYRRALKEGEAITPQSLDADLHELRKTCKKLRYLIEFFQVFYPDKAIRNLLKQLKQLQDNLGDFQDLCIQTTQLNHFAEQMQQEGHEGYADTKTIMAMGVLVEKLYLRKTVVRAEFHRRFKTFAQPETSNAFSDLFNPQHQPEGISV